MEKLHFRRGATGDTEGFPTTHRPAWRERRRRRILDAAAALFARRSFRDVNMEDVAATALVGKATLYRYFPSKVELYVAIFDATLEELASRLDSVVTAGARAPDLLEQAVGVVLPTLATLLSDMGVSDEGLVLLAERKRHLLCRRRQDIIARIERILARGVASGELRPMDVEFCANMVVGLIWAGAVSSSLPPPVAAQKISELFLAGTLPNPAAAARRDSPNLTADLVQI